MARGKGEHPGSGHQRGQRVVVHRPEHHRLDFELRVHQRVGLEQLQ
ncbi:MAG: hypothetical protein ACRDRW_17825 [Pseudonocardiaceae bacterium]